MQKATFENFSRAYDNLKSGSGCAITNIFQFGNELQKTLERKDCLMHSTQDSIFLLVPTHDIYYECFFVASNKNSLSKELATVLPLVPKSHLIRASIIGKEHQAEEIYQIFVCNNFSLIKKLLRIKLTATNKKIMEAMRPFTEEYRDCIAYAKDGDEDEIQEILRDNFDTVGDNIPDKIDIRDHIAENKIVVLRQDGKIASFFYFDVHGNVLHSLYAVTRKEYRGGNGFFMAISYFAYEDFFKRGIKFNRSLGWIDATEKKLLKNAKERQGNWDGVVIYNMLHKLDPGHGVCAGDNS